MLVTVVVTFVLPFIASLELGRSLQLPLNEEVGSLEYFQDKLVVFSNTATSISPVYSYNLFNLTLLTTVSGLEAGHNRFLWSYTDRIHSFIFAGALTYNVLETSMLNLIQISPLLMSYVDHILLKFVGITGPFYPTVYVIDPSREFIYTVLNQDNNNMALFNTLEIGTGLSDNIPLVQITGIKRYWTQGFVKNAVLEKDDMLVLAGFSAPGDACVLMQINVTAQTIVATSGEYAELVDVLTVYYDSVEGNVYWSVEGSRIVKMNAALEITAVLELGYSDVYAMEDDGLFLYAVTYESPTKVLKISKATFQVFRYIEVDDSHWVKRSLFVEGAGMGELYDLIFLGAQNGRVSEVMVQTCVPGESRPIPCSLCGPGNYSSTYDAEHCEMCVRGYYSNATGAASVDTCQVCPNGTYSDVYAASSIDSCFLCDAGYFCGEQSISAVGGTEITPDDVQICDCGFYCPAGSADSEGWTMDEPFSKPCEETYYCLQGSTNSSGGGHCDDGYYCPAMSCSPIHTECPAGHFCLNGNKTLCGPGSWNVQGPNSECTPCPPGYYSSEVGKSTSCDLLCAPGYFCPEGSIDSHGRTLLDSNEKGCLGGYYCLEGSVDQFGRLDIGLDVHICSCGYYCSNYSTSAQGATIFEDISHPCDETRYCVEGSNDQSGSGVCAQGYFCGQGSCNDTNEQCPAGYFCTGGGRAECPEGTWNEKGVHPSCEVCGPGTFESTPGFTQPCIQQCSAGYYCRGGAIDEFGTLWNETVETRKYCEAGYYCEVGSYDMFGRTIDEPEIHVCDCGFYCMSGSVGAQGQTIADPSTSNMCDESFYCPPGSTVSTGSGSCIDGYYCPPGSCNNTFEVCPAGYYCTTGLRFPCEVGTWKEAKVSTTCDLCEPGVYNDETQLGVECYKPCTCGFFCDEYGTINGEGGTTVDPTPKPCDETYYCPEASIDPYVSGHCDDGYYCAQMSCSATNSLCTAGYKCQGGNRTVCPIGTYNDEGANMECTPCGFGRYTISVQTPDFSNCLSCGAGYYSDNLMSSLSDCTSCPTGYFGIDGVVGSFSQVCSQCPAGSWNDVLGATGSSSCNLCPMGTASNIVGASLNNSCVDCGVSQYTLQEGSAQCLTCADPIDCPPGTSPNVPGTERQTSDADDPFYTTNLYNNRLWWLKNVLVWACVACVVGFGFIVVPLLCFCYHKNFWSVLLGFDILYSRKHFVLVGKNITRKKTVLGGVCSIVALILISFLSITSLIFFVTDNIETNERYVNFGLSEEKEFASHTYGNYYVNALVVGNFDNTVCGNAANVTSSGWLGSSAYYSQYQEDGCKMSWYCLGCELEGMLQGISFSFSDKLYTTAIEISLKIPSVEENLNFTIGGNVLARNGYVFSGTTSQTVIESTLHKTKHIKKTIASSVFDLIKKNLFAEERIGMKGEINKITPGEEKPIAILDVNSGFIVSFNFVVSSSMLLLEDYVKQTFLAFLAQIGALIYLVAVVFEVIMWLIEFCLKTAKIVPDDGEIEMKENEEGDIQGFTNIGDSIYEFNMRKQPQYLLADKSVNQEIEDSIVDEKNDYLAAEAEVLNPQKLLESPPGSQNEYLDEEEGEYEYEEEEGEVEEEGEEEND